MSAGLESTSISETGALTLGQDASGKLVIIASNEDKTVQDKLEITILETPDLKENDLLKVTGGVDLTNDGTIVFPEEMINVDGVGNEETYKDMEYSAVLKNTYTKDFDIEFEVSDYKTTAAYPKLQIALGGGRNNFYVAYKTDGTCRIEAFAGGVFQNGTYSKGWFNSNAFTDFDASKTHKFKIKVANDGTYEVYQDGNKLSFSMDGNSATLKRDYETYVSDANIKFATKGVSAKVSNIVVNNGTSTELPEFWKYSDNVSYNVETKELQLRFTDLGWATKDQYANRVISTQKLDDNFALDYDVEFSDATADTKLVLKIGNYEYQICNKLLTNTPTMDGYLYAGSWNGKDISATNNVSPLSNHVRFERNEGHVRYILNDVLIGQADYAEGDHIEFYAFNSDSASANQTVTIKNIQVSEYSMKNLYDFYANGNTTRTLSVGGTDTLDLNAKINGIDAKDATFTYEVTDKSIISFDEANKTVTALAVGQTTLKITWVEAKKVIELTYDISERPTESNLLKVNGGVLLEGENGLIFTEANNGVNGVGDETKYVENSYSADLKQKVKGDFDIEFKVSDYKVKEGTNYPKLMISLGGTHNQFYIAYKPNGEYRVETFTNYINSTEDNSYISNGGWINSENFTNFDTTAEHTYRIAVIKGQYHIYMDGKELTMNLDGTTKLIARSFSDYTSETPIRISTNGVSCKVSEIKLTQTGIKDKFYALNQTNITDITEAGFTLKACNGSWGNKDNWINKIALLNSVNENVTITFNLKSSGTLGDGKFMIDLGGNTVMINYKNDKISANINGIGHDWDTGTMVATYASDISVKIIRENGNIKVFIDDKLFREFDNAASGETLGFSIFNENEAYKDVIFTLSNLEIK